MSNITFYTHVREIEPSDDDIIADNPPFGFFVGDNANRRKIKVQCMDNSECEMDVACGQVYNIRIKKVYKDKTKAKKIFVLW